MSNRVTLLYFVPVAIITIAVAIPNHIRTGDRRYDMWEAVRTIVALGSFWFIVFAAVFRFCWSLKEWISRDADHKAEPPGFEVSPPTAKNLTDDGEIGSKRLYPSEQRETQTPTS